MIADCFDEYESFTNNDGSYSDQIDSDVEAELYGFIHHEQVVEFSNVTPDIKVLSVKSNFDHEEHISTSKQTTFVSDSIPTPTFFFSSEASTKTYFSSPQSHLSVSSENSFPNMQDSSLVKHLVFNESNKRKRDLTDVYERKKGKKQSIDSKGNINLSKKGNHLDPIDYDKGVIIIERSKAFKSNLSKPQTVELSSDDSSDTDLIFRRRLSYPDNKNNQNNHDPWHINEEDFYRDRKHSISFDRYHFMKCTKCERSGHSARTCPNYLNRKCFICGGQHSVGCCHNAICSQCYTKGHTSMNCQKFDNRSCRLCNMDGHLQMNCPDIWRRYHLTTSNSEFKKGSPSKQDVPLYCFNCGGKGHFGSECVSSRMHSFETNYPTWPVVISYGDDKEVFSKKGKHKRWMSKQHSTELKCRDNTNRNRYNVTTKFYQNDNNKHQSILLKKKVKQNTCKWKVKQKRNGQQKNQLCEELVNEAYFPRTPKNMRNRKRKFTRQF